MQSEIVDKTTVRKIQAAIEYTDESTSRMLFDLTLIYGAGNEPTTPEQFEADYQRWFGKPLEYEEYDEGSIRSVRATGIKTVGFNLYGGGDFEGILSSTNWSRRVLYKNDCGYSGAIIINADVECDTIQNIFRIEYTNGSVSYVGNLYTPGKKSHITVATNEENTVNTIIGWYSINVSIKITNLCINFSWSGKRDGDYEPYWEETKALPITTLTSGSKVIFPDGLKRAGDVYDEILIENGVTKAIKRVQELHIGENGLEGTTYETPEVYILDNFELPLNYKVDDFGTEQILMPEDSIAPIIATRYGINAVDTLRRLNDRYLQIKDINNYTDTKQDKLPEGEPGQHLVKTEQGVKWEYSNLPIDLVSYGVEWDINVSNPACTRIGNPLLHKSLPIQSKMRGCVAKGKEIQYYLDPNDWSKKLDGTESVLDGTDGSVMVHIPRFYGRSFIDGDKRSVRISETRIDSTWIEIPEMLVSAYHPTVDNTDTSNPKLVSVVNTSTAFRGGNNSATYDQYLDSDKFRTHLGKGRTSTTRAKAREYARNAGVELLSYEQYKWVFYWLFVIEYATFNSQAAYNAELTSDGYRQGGLGSAVTTGNSTYWSLYNGSNPVIPNGFTNSIGNFTGVINTEDIKFLYSGDTTLDIDSFSIATAACVATKDTTNHSMTITNVLQANVNMLTHDLQHTIGYVKYHVKGLQEGQTLLFFEGSTQINSINEDGDVTVHWDPDNLGTRAIRANFTGECNITISSSWESPEDAEITLGNFGVPRYRGIEQPFGDIWTNLDGIIIDPDCGETGRNDNLDIVYTTNNPKYYGEEITDDYHVAGLGIHQDGYIKQFDLGDTAETIPKTVGAASTTWKCDCRYSGNKNNTNRALFVGGYQHYGANAGLGVFYSYYGLVAASANIGFRSSVIL